MDGNATQVADWLLAHPELAAQWAADKAKQNPPRPLSMSASAVRQRQYMQRHPEKRAYYVRKAKEWHTKFPERVKASKLRQRTPAIRAREKAAAMVRRQTKREAFLWRNAKNRAMERGIEFTITIADIVIPPLCPVFGVPFDMAGSQDRKRIRLAPSLDRVDNRLGYVPGNVMVISLRANQIKTDATAEEIRAVADFYEKLEAQAMIG